MVHQSMSLLEQAYPKLPPVGRAVHTSLILSSSSTAGGDIRASEVPNASGAPPGHNAYTSV
jgi:hypothetical protein